MFRQELEQLLEHDIVYIFQIFCFMFSFGRYFPFDTSVLWPFSKTDLSVAIFHLWQSAEAFDVLHHYLQYEAYRLESSGRELAGGQPFDPRDLTSESHEILNDVRCFEVGLRRILCLDFLYLEHFFGRKLRLDEIFQEFAFWLTSFMIIGKLTYSHLCGNLFLVVCLSVSGSSVTMSCISTTSFTVVSWFHC